MNGNTPYAGLPGVTKAGQRAAADVPSLTSDQKRMLHRDVSLIADRTRRYLPNEYAVDADVTHGITGPEVTVAVQPPVGHAISAGFTPDVDGSDGEFITADERTEVARGLAASAALQVKLAVSGDVTPTAR